MQNDTTQDMIESYRKIAVEDLPSYSKSEVDNELLNSQTFLTASAEHTEAGAGLEQALLYEPIDESSKPRRMLFKNLSRDNFCGSTDPY